MRVHPGIVVLAALLIINTIILILVSAFVAWPWFGENGIIETAQVVILILAFFSFARLTRAPTPAVRFLYASAMIICLFCVLRELDFDPDGALRDVDYLIGGPARIVVAAIAVPVFALFIYHCIKLPGALQRLIFATHTGRLWIIGCIVVAAGALFDHKYLAEAVPHLWEELLELNGFAILAMSSLIPHADAERAVASLPRRN